MFQIVINAAATPNTNITCFWAPPSIAFSARVSPSSGNLGWFKNIEKPDLLKLWKLEHTQQHKSEYFQSPQMSPLSPYRVWEWMSKDVPFHPPSKWVLHLLLSPQPSAVLYYWKEGSKPSLSTVGVTFMILTDWWTQQGLQHPRVGKTRAHALLLFSNWEIENITVSILTEKLILNAQTSRQMSSNDITHTVW